MSELTILIADDHEVVRRGLRLMVESRPGWRVCGEACTGPETVEKAAQLRPNIVVLDHGMPGLNGVDATRRIKELSPATEVIVFSGTESDRLIQDVFEAGARSYISKGETSKHLVAAIEKVAEHKPYFTEHVSQIVFARFLQRESSSTAELEEGSRLTTREREIVQMLAEGKTNKEMAEALGISVRTAESHRSALMWKLNLRNTADIVRYAIRNEIIQA